MLNKLVKNMTLRTQIVAVVVALSVLPLLLFGLYSLQIAGNAKSSSNKVKNTLMISIGKEIANYFIDINTYMNFTRPLEKRMLSDEIEIGKILLEALSENKNAIAIAYIKNARISYFLGDEIKNPDINHRLTDLLKSYEGDKWIQISDSFKFNKKSYFDLLYPLKTGDFVMVTFSLQNIQEKLSANSIGKTGKFAIVNESGVLFVGEKSLNTRLQFLEIEKSLKESTSSVLIEEKRGYEIKAIKQKDMLWPIWLIFTQKESEANSLMNSLRLSIVAMLIMLLVVSGSISFMLSNSFSRPIYNLLTAVKKNFNGELEEKAVLDDRDSGELAILINEFNRLISNLKETRGQLVEKEKLAALGEMASVIGHDIRNPLAAIKNGVYYLRYSVKSDNPRVETTLGIIDREIESIKQIIEDLLGYSRQRPPALSVVEINSLLEEVISIIEVPENITIEKEFEDEIENFQLDRGEMRQVLVNLINNAVQAIEKENGKVTVISKTESSGDLGIIIKDNGMGIPGDKLNKIFEAFYSTKEGGTGLGLASAKRIVERHQGKLNVRSKHKIGTEIIISIPKEIKIEEEN